MELAAEQDECAHRAKRQYVDRTEGILLLPDEIFVTIFSTLATPVVLRRVGAVCEDWHAIVKDDELWRLRCGLSELPPGFNSWFAYVQRQTMREQALDHLYGRAGLTQDWRKGLQLLSVLVDAGDDYAMALYGWALYDGAGIRSNQARGEQVLQQSKHVIARAFCIFFEVGVASNLDEAYRLLSTECDTSDPHVQCLLGICFRYGYGCNRDDAKSVRCFERAGNHILALNSLAFALERQGSSTFDRRRAISLYRKAAMQGSSVAQVHLGFGYQRGMPDVLEKDTTQARYWFSLSAEHGYVPAGIALQLLEN